MTETHGTYRTRQILLAEQIADEAELMIESDSIAYVKLQIHRIAQLVQQRKAEKEGIAPCA